jgi:hypothetical protein
MLRRILISTSILAFWATPALPQLSPAQTSRASVAAAVASAPSMRAALRAWGLDRQTRTNRFNKVAVTNERATFDTLALEGPDGAKTTLENLVITRSNLPGPTFGHFTIVGDKFSDADGTRIERISIVGLRGGSNLISAVKALSNVTALRARPVTGGVQSMAFADSVSISDVSTNVTSADRPRLVRLAQVDLTQVTFDNQMRGFETLTLKDGAFDFKQYTTTFSSVEVRGVGADLLTSLDTAEGTPATPLDVMGLALGHLSINGLNYAFKGQGNQAPPLNNLTLDRLSVDNIKDGLIGQFSMSGLKLNGGVGSKAWKMGLDRFNLGEVNLNYFAKLGESFSLAFNKKPPPNPSQPNPSQPNPSQPNPSQPNPSQQVATNPVPATPRAMLKDILKGGPLDSGMGSISLGNLSAEAGGFNFNIDQIGLTQVRESGGIIIRADLAPTQMRFSWPTQALDGPVQASARNTPAPSLLASLGTDHVTMRFSGASTFSPQTDRVAVENYEIEVVDWGKVKMDFALTGVAQMMAETSFEDVIAASLPGPSRTRANPMDQLKPMLALYKNISLNTARMEVFDLGGLDKAARIFAARGRNAASVQPIATPQQLLQQRVSWAEKPRNASGDKTKPALERQFSIAIARWLENGGSLAIAVNPSTPIAMATLADQATVNPASWGLAITNRAPATTNRP